MKTKRLATHLFELDATEHAGHRGTGPCPSCPCKRCPLPYANRAHELPDTAEAQAAHLRRIGDDQ